MARKTASQLQSLQQLYLENKYPTKELMEDNAAALGLTYKQVRGWFIERRRRDKRENGSIVPSCSASSKKNPILTTRVGSGTIAARKVLKGDPLLHKAKASLSLISNRPSTVETRIRKRKRKPILLQHLFTSDYILKKVFRKEGPPLGVEFDSLPSRAFCCHTDPKNSRPSCQDNQGAGKRLKVSEQAILSHQVSNKKSAPTKKHGIGKGLMAPAKKHGIGKGLMTQAKKHGIGKGLMTVWRATNPDGGDIPTGIDYTDREVVVSPISTSTAPKKPQHRVKRSQRAPVAKQVRLRNKAQDRRKQSTRRREDEHLKQPDIVKCELALEGAISREDLNHVAMLVDDEELELQELQAGPNPLRCSDHFAANGIHGCSLCKDLLAKFPPNSVKMKHPFCTQPWDSSPEIVKKLFKVFHFLYTYAVAVDICSFTLDEFAQSFHDKDSLLLGKIHVALLKLLISEVEAELSNGYFPPHLSISCNFLALLHSAENQKVALAFWKRALNPLTWTEILRQVLVAAGFGSKQGAMRREALNKEMNLMVKYGLRPGTLKCELFKILSEQGNNGLKVSELAKSLPIAELNIASTTEELESLICSSLSSDITLFEKISSSSYRLRISSVAKEVDEFQSDTEDSGSVDDDPNDRGLCSDSDDSGCESGNSNLRKFKYMSRHKSQNNMLIVHNEIDESHPGEVWLLGLMEGEYSDLSIEEKLNALVAITDLLLASSSIRVEDPTQAIAECAPNIHHYGSGAKLKRSSTKQHSIDRPSWGYAGQMHSIKEAYSLFKFHPVDSSVSISKSYEKERSSGEGENVKEKEVESGLHLMQSVFLGSDRRYNRYWLFLGPCSALGPCSVYDPGHRRVYFESSEDGHWEVIDTVEDLRALLSVLDDRGKREAILIESLEKRQAFLCQAMSNKIVKSAGTRHLTQSDQSELDMVREDSCSPVSDVDNLSLTETIKDSLPSSGAVVLDVGNKGEEQQERWNRLQEFDSWIWNSFYSNLNAVKHGKRSYLDSLARCESCHDLYWRDEKHCRICHTTFELDFDLEERYAIHAATCREKEDSEILFPQHKVLSSQIQSLKAAIHAIESVMPEEALVGAWTKSAHKLWVKRLRRTSSMADLLQVLADFVGAINEDWLCECNGQQVSFNIIEETITSFASMPQTSSAVALWLVELDALIAPYLEKVRFQKRPEISIKGRCAPKQSMQLS
ncbi:homeobox-DDT domain protein RLT3 isoform X2 [Quercus lobata]|uniref:homeobox-DDT domain protein RLT3 isoform X2 n=1 Tax=Quercus lobata TaxID=97700 RepID=UPI001248608C|nr:homeobox-DDT domain protein RLT3 isoform X2 [Quercus lobata]